MDLTLLLPVLATALSIGLGCGTCCSPAVSLFLSTYIIAHAGGMKRSLWSFLIFFIGKVTAVVLLCALASLIGNQFISAAGMIGSFNLRLILELAMTAMGLWLIGRWLVHYRQPDAHCAGCTGEKSVPAKGFLPLFAAGFAYGASPCSSLVMIIGVCATLPLTTAILVSTVFAAASTLTPVLLMLMLSGVLSGKIAREIPRQLPWFQLGSYVLITLFSAAALVNL
ncbi:hypothetical protein GH808_02445 [Acetobacterium fimetarium]|uniref:Urease accessory protein UreH-like transmembrane domain-containing protein n=1 Tax=Acetobacterium fimetarium TaxID=52691 RepID=A0ABR6WRS6_9FIRM|nr:sulfite exporter TauE/SafE family protein [Acetobacterium fimetarium]MBC3803304.1 hypothetical protein [Acetobacterium fimetarium]